MLRHNFCSTDGRLLKLFLFSTLLNKSPLTSIYFATLEKKKGFRSPLPTQSKILVFGFTKNQKVRLYGQGRSDFSLLFKSCEILEVRGDLSIINVENKKSLRADHQACKNYALALVLCAFNNSKSI